MIASSSGKVPDSYLVLPDMLCLFHDQIPTPNAIPHPTPNPTPLTSPLLASASASQLQKQEKGRSRGREYSNRNPKTKNKSSASRLQKQQEGKRREHSNFKPKTKTKNPTHKTLNLVSSALAAKVRHTLVDPLLPGQHERTTVLTMSESEYEHSDDDGSWSSEEMRSEDEEVSFLLYDTFFSNHIYKI